ncbi:MAG TPA: SDR family oxidoreductase [Acidimicrobiales bacterium]|nr:SDR family oxidoreductase [Acidimicrobiales bacterium]
MWRDDATAGVNGHAAQALGGDSTPRPPEPRDSRPPVRAAEQAASPASAAGGAVVVTGCGQGIGLAIFERLVAEGYSLVGIELEPELAAGVRQRFRQGHEVLVGDVAETEVFERAAAAAASLPGGLAGWVNSAGITRQTNLHEVDPGLVERVLRVNLLGCYWGCAEAVQQFLRQRSGGCIVNISSVHARAAYVNHSAYAISKAGIEALTRYVAVEYARFGIRANAVAPGGVRTPANLLVNSEESLAEMGRAHPMGRIGTADEIAGVVAFLFSADAGFVTGHTLVADGGLTARCWSFDPDPMLLAAYGLDGDDADAASTVGSSAVERSRE